MTATFEPNLLSVSRCLFLIAARISASPAELYASSASGTIPIFSIVNTSLGAQILFFRRVLISMPNASLSPVSLL